MDVAIEVNASVYTQFELAGGRQFNQVVSWGLSYGAAPLFTIGRGDYPVSGNLPGELSLMGCFRLSRHSAHEVAPTDAPIGHRDACANERHRSTDIERAIEYELPMSLNQILIHRVEDEVSCVWPLANQLKERGTGEDRHMSPAVEKRRFIRGHWCLPIEEIFGVPAIDMLPSGTATLSP
jgi:hypothetical protein